MSVVENCVYMPQTHNMRIKHTAICLCLQWLQLAASLLKWTRDVHVCPRGVEKYNPTDSWRWRWRGTPPAVFPYQLLRAAMSSSFFRRQASHINSHFPVRSKTGMHPWGDSELVNDANLQEVYYLDDRIVEGRMLHTRLGLGVSQLPWPEVNWQ